VTILNRILAEKKKEVALLKEQTFPVRSSHKKISLYDSFRKSETLNVIAEIKRASPSKGDIRVDVDPKIQALRYVQAGANAISVLTDTPFFKGSMEDLAAVREVVDVPILNKDFIIDKVQIDRAKAYGADVILLIAAALSMDKLEELYVYAYEQGMEVLLEVHNEEELELALAIEPKIIGINNRNLHNFEVSLKTTEILAEKVRSQEILLISESGIFTNDDAKRVAASGAKGILVGEALMRADHMEELIQDLKISVGVEI
jgi:indole-3-glycerol phosphate synthase